MSWRGVNQGRLTGVQGECSPELGKQRALGASCREQEESCPQPQERGKPEAAAEKARLKPAPETWPAVSPCSLDKVVRIQRPGALGSGLWGEGSEGCLLSFLGRFL